MSRAEARRQELEASEIRWLGALSQRLTRRFYKGTPRRQVLDALCALPVGTQPHEPAQLVIEQGRTLGKTEQVRAWLLERALTRRERGAVVSSERGEDAQATASSIMAILPHRRASGSERIAWRKTAMGVLYPNVGWSGGVKQLLIHLDKDTVFPLWCRGTGGQIRGLNLNGVRPSLFIGDDIITSASGYSRAKTEARLRLVNEEAVGLSQDVMHPVNRVVIVNAIRRGDFGEQLREAGWTAVHGSVWRTPAGDYATGLPPSAAHQQALRLAAAGERIPDALLLEALAGHRTSDPDHDPRALLAKEAGLGSAIFNRAFCCARLSDDVALWPWHEVARVAVGPRDLRVIGVWLDPRYSEDRVQNDFAACAAVGIRHDGTSVILAAEALRCELDEQRALLWRIIDRVQASYAAPIIAGFEANSVGAFLARDFSADAAQRRAQKRHVPPMRGYPSSARKTGPERLERLVGPIQTGALAVATGALTDEVERQCRELGTGYHDDAPDAIERAEALARGLT